MLQATISRTISTGPCIRWNSRAPQMPENANPAIPLVSAATKIASATAMLPSRNPHWRSVSQ